MTATSEPGSDDNDDVEFDDWKWVDYWKPVDEVINFKRDVYEDMLKALAPILFENEHSIPSKFSRPLQDEECPREYQPRCQSS